MRRAGSRRRILSRQTDPRRPPRRHRRTGRNPRTGAGAGRVEDLGGARHRPLRHGGHPDRGYIARQQDLELAGGAGRSRRGTRVGGSRCLDRQFRTRPADRWRRRRTRAPVPRRSAGGRWQPARHRYPADPAPRTSPNRFRQRARQHPPRRALRRRHARRFRRLQPRRAGRSRGAGRLARPGRCRTIAVAATPAASQRVGPAADRRRHARQPRNRPQPDRRAARQPARGGRSHCHWPGRTAARCRSRRAAGRYARDPRPPRTGRLGSA